MKIHSVKGGAGINLNVREYGSPSGIPILFIHGWSQSHLCWSKQFESSLRNDAQMIAVDLRGHGMSDAPVELDQYTDGDKWADDVEAVIDELALDRPILVAGHMEATSFLTMCAEKARTRFPASILSVPLWSLARRLSVRLWVRASWRAHQAPLRTIFRPISRQCGDSYVRASSSQSRRTILKKSWRSTWWFNRMCGAR